MPSERDNRPRRSLRTAVRETAQNYVITNYNTSDNTAIWDTSNYNVELDTSGSSTTRDWVSTAIPPQVVAEITRDARERYERARRSMDTMLREQEELMEQIHATRRSNKDPDWEV